MDVAENLVRTWKHEFRDAVEVAAQLLATAQELYERAIVADECGVGFVIDVELALKAIEFKTYLNACCELQKVSLVDLNETQRLVFFLNVYQCMYIHYFLKTVSECSRPKPAESFT